MNTGFQVETNNNEKGGYKIYINRSKKPFRAATTTEVRTALEHWALGAPYYGNSHYLLTNPRCPICRGINGE